jgi:hypothetical protein
MTELVDVAPDGPEWLHEIKFDGYRRSTRPVEAQGSLARRAARYGRVTESPSSLKRNDDGPDIGKRPEPRGA